MQHHNIEINAKKKKIHSDQNLHLLSKDTASRGTTTGRVGPSGDGVNGSEPACRTPAGHPALRGPLALILTFSNVVLKYHLS